jgi:hypothetical protein
LLSHISTHSNLPLPNIAGGGVSVTRFDSARPVVHGMIVYVTNAVLSKAVIFLETTLPVNVNTLLDHAGKSKLSVLTCPSINAPPKRTAFIGRTSVNTILVNGNIPVLDTVTVYDTNDPERSVVPHVTVHVFVIVSP